MKNKSNMARFHIQNKKMNDVFKKETKILNNCVQICKFQCNINKIHAFCYAFHALYCSWQGRNLSNFQRNVCNVDRFVDENMSCLKTKRRVFKQQTQNKSGAQLHEIQKQHGAFFIYKPKTCVTFQKRKQKV